MADMQKFLPVFALLMVLGGILIFGVNKDGTSDASSSNAEDTVVRQFVTEFGTKLQTVSLLASTANRKAAMDANYAAYVAPELLTTWYPEGAEGALGRYTSSPWPKKIDIVEVRATGENFVVEGNVIEVANDAGANEAVAAVYPVTLSLEKREGKWMIIKAEKGAYSALPQRRTIIGYWECLPHKNTSGPQTAECALGIAVDQSDGHYALDTRLMAQYPVNFSTGTKVRVSGVVTPAEQLSSIQKYDIDGVISATEIVEIK
jgi:hypothetical protein